MYLHFKCLNYISKTIYASTYWTVRISGRHLNQEELVVRKLG